MLLLSYCQILKAFRMFIRINRRLMDLNRDSSIGTCWLWVFQNLKNKFKKWVCNSLIDWLILYLLGFLKLLMECEKSVNYNNYLCIREKRANMLRKHIRRSTRGKHLFTRSQPIRQIQTFKLLLSSRLKRLTTITC